MNFLLAKEFFSKDPAANQHLLEAIIQLVDQLMNEGIYSDEFLDILYSKESHCFHSEFILPAFKKSLQSLGVKPLNCTRAMLYIINDILNQVVDELDDPFTLIDKLYCEYLSESYDVDQIKQYYQLYDLMCLYFSLEDINYNPELSFNNKYGEEAIMEIKSKIKVAAKRWLVENSDRL